MRKKEEILNDFQKIERRFLQKDIEITEAEIRSNALLAEVLLDIRTNMLLLAKAINPNYEPEENTRLRNVTE